MIWVVRDAGVDARVDGARKAGGLCMSAPFLRARQLFFADDLPKRFRV